jgi:hypothetical protein
VIHVLPYTDLSATVAAHDGRYGVSQQVIDSIQLEHSGAREATHSGMTLKGVGKDRTRKAARVPPTAAAAAARAMSVDARAAMVRRVTATLCGRTLDETAMNALPRPEKLVLMLHLHRLAATTATGTHVCAPRRRLILPRAADDHMRGNPEGRHMYLRGGDMSFAQRCKQLRPYARLPL